MIDRDISSAQNLFASLKAALAYRDGDQYDESWQDARHDLITEIHGWAIDESQPNGRVEAYVVVLAEREHAVRGQRGGVMTDVPTPQQILALPMQENDAGAATIRDYLIALLAMLWDEKEGFNGKRPFGNSDWDGHLVIALVRAGLVDGEIDEDGYLDGCDDDAVEELIADAIQALGYSEADAP